MSTIAETIGARFERLKAEQEHWREVAHRVWREYFGLTCDLEFHIRDSLMARGFNVVHSDHHDGNLFRYYEFDTEEDVERLLRLLGPLNEVLSEYEGDWVCGPVEDASREVAIPIVSLWIVAQYLAQRHGRL